MSARLYLAEIKPVRNRAFPSQLYYEMRGSGMFLSRFALPRGARYRLYVGSQLYDDSSAADADERTMMTSINELSSRLKNLCMPNIVRRLNEFPGACSAKLELDFADYVAVCGERQGCPCDRGRDSAGVGDVSMGKSTHVLVSPQATSSTRPRGDDSERRGPVLRRQRRRRRG